MVAETRPLSRFSLEVLCTGREGEDDRKRCGIKNQAVGEIGATLDGVEFIIAHFAHLAVIRICICISFLLLESLVVPVLPVL